MVKARNAAPDIAWLGGLAFGLDPQVADDIDALARRGVLQGDAGRPDGADLADGRAVKPCDRPAGPAEEDIGQPDPPLAPGGRVHVEHAIPRGARLYPG